VVAEDGEKVKEKEESEGVDEDVHNRTSCLRMEAKSHHIIYCAVIIPTECQDGSQNRSRHVFMYGSAYSRHMRTVYGCGRGFTGR
jgi:hypothetical protein